MAYSTPNALREAYLSNISLGGVFIKTENPLIPGERFYLKLTVFDKQQGLDIFSEVVWSRGEKVVGQEQKFPPGMGVKLLC